MMTGGAGVYKCRYPMSKPWDRIYPEDRSPTISDAATGENAELENEDDDLPDGNATDVLEVDPFEREESVTDSDEE
jgi:hypothetical protein